MDFTHADESPLYVIEQEPLVFRQNKLSMDEFYGLVNEKLNRIVNKINMTCKEKTTANAFIEGAKHYEHSLLVWTTKEESCFMQRIQKLYQKHMQVFRLSIMIKTE